MNRRKLGGSELDVSPLALGTNVFGWTIDERQSFEILDALVDADFNFVDTADTYSRWAPGNKGGESETIIGKWVKRTRKREKIVIATKVGSEMSPSEKGLSRDYILRAAERSLRRLETDYIDLYQSHVDDPQTPLEETLGAYAELVQEGKVRAIGASNFTGERLSDSLGTSQEHGFPRYESLQPLYNLYDRTDYEEKLEPVCLQHGLGVIPYYSLASGFLTGKYRSEADLSQSPRGQGVKKYLNERGFRILKALDEVAEQYRSTPAEVSLAWLLARPSITAPIASATNLHQLHSLIKATEMELDSSAIERLNRASELSSEAGA